MNRPRVVMAGVGALALATIGIPAVAVLGITGTSSTATACQPATGTAPAIAGDLGTFLTAIRTHESGGNYTAQNHSGSDASGAYQFLGTTWTSEATAAGQAAYAHMPAYQAPPAVQDAVAGFMATGAFNGPAQQNWGRVADIWYVGHIASAAELDVVPAGGNTITPRQYEQQIAALMTQVVAGGTTTTVGPLPIAATPLASTTPTSVSDNGGSTTATTDGSCGTTYPQTASGPGVDGYVNPYSAGKFTPARTDQGIDYLPVEPSPMLAIGDGIVTYSSTSTGWPGGAFETIKLTAGPKTGSYYYIAEHLTGLLPVGTLVTAGQQIATALPGYPWTESGWATPGVDLPCPVCRYNGAGDGTATEGGKMFTRFIAELGEPVQQDPGPGPDAP